MRTRVGYAGGTLPDPTYHRLGDHTESLQIDYDPTRLSYTELLEMFWTGHHPGSESFSRQYMAAVFYANAQQKQDAMESRDRVAVRLGHEVRTIIAPLTRFYRAEDYHQKYSLRHHPLLMAELEGYTPPEFVDSTVAARLNGYVARQGNPAQLADEIDDFGLSAPARQKLESLVR